MCDIEDVLKLEDSPKTPFKYSLGGKPLKSDVALSPDEVDGLAPKFMSIAENLGRPVAGYIYLDGLFYVFSDPEFVGRLPPRL